MWMEGAKSTILTAVQSNQVRKRRLMWLEPVLNIHSFLSSTLPPVLLFVRLQLIIHKKILGRKNICRSYLPTNLPLCPTLCSWGDWPVMFGKYLELNLTFVGPCIANIFSEYNQQDATFLKFNYFCKTLYTFQTVFPSIIRSTKLHTQRQAFVTPLLLPATNSR